MVKIVNVEFTEVRDGVLRSQILLKPTHAARISLEAVGKSNSGEHITYAFVSENPEVKFVRLYIFDLKKVEVYGKQPHIGNRQITPSKEFPPEGADWKEAARGAFCGIWVRDWRWDLPVNFIHLARRQTLDVYRIWHGNSNELVRAEDISAVTGISVLSLIDRFASLSMRAVTRGEILCAFADARESEWRNVHHLMRVLSNRDLYLVRQLGKEIIDLTQKGFVGVVLRESPNSDDYEIYDDEEHVKSTYLNFDRSNTRWVHAIAVKFFPLGDFFGWQRYQPNG